MKTILLPTDFSKNSINAISYAVKLFEAKACRFYILNIQKASSFISDDMMGVSSLATVYNTLIDTAKMSITNIITQVKKTSNTTQHEFHAIVDYDNFIDAINQITEKQKVDLIIMGTKGASGLDKVIFGSNTIHVLQRCKVPVLVIPEGCMFKKIDNVAFTCSFSTTYSVKNFETLKYLMQLNNSKLKVLHVSEKNKLEEKLNENTIFFKSNFPQVSFDRIAMSEDEIYNIIHKYIKDNTIEMIVMLGKKHSFLERFFVKHAVEIFAFKIDIPFLVIPE